MEKEGGDSEGEPRGRKKIGNAEKNENTFSGKRGKKKGKGVCYQLSRGKKPFLREKEKAARGKRGKQPGGGVQGILTIVRRQIREKKREIWKENPYSERVGRKSSAVRKKEDFHTNQNRKLRHIEEEGPAATGDLNY